VALYAFISHDSDIEAEKGVEDGVEESSECGVVTEEGCFLKLCQKLVHRLL